MNTIGNIEQEPNSGYSRLEQQIKWYDSKSIQSQRYYKRIKIAEICFSALIPFVARINSEITAFLGVAIVIFEGLQHVNQWSQNWITYRSTCEALRHEKYSYIGRSGVYDGKADEEALRVLIGRVESLISTEHAKWISKQEYEIKRMRQSKDKRDEV